MIDRFRRHLADTGLAPEGARILVAYSGGADSTCLLHLLHSVGVDIVAAHLHHGQRSDADREQALCGAFCDDLGIPFATGTADVPRMSQDLGIGLEEAGRHARYTFLAQAAARTGCALIATGHTRTDHVETILLNLVRGCGLRGLGGIPARRDNIVRPLLPFTREETRAYCAEHGLWTHDDPSNVDVNFSRARVRLRVLPELTRINPSADAAIARMSEVAREEDAFLNGMAAAALEQSELPIHDELAFLTRDVEIRFDRAQLTTLPAVLLKRALRLGVEALGGELDAHQTAEAVTQLAGQAKGSVTSERGEVAIEWDEHAIHLRDPRPTEPFRFHLTVPGETASDEFGWRFEAFHAPREGFASVRSSMEAAIDPKSVKGQLYFRTAGAGDAMRPLGFDHHRKLSDLLSEARLTAAARRRLPIVCDMVGPLWAPGVCLDQRCALGEDAQTALVIRFGPLLDPVKA